LVIVLDFLLCTSKGTQPVSCSCVLEVILHPQVVLAFDGDQRVIVATAPKETLEETVRRCLAAPSACPAFSDIKIKYNSLTTV
jgi:autonomous glycyl radical cofactor GrcA